MKINFPKQLIITPAPQLTFSDDKSKQRQLTLLGAWLARSIDGDFDGLRVGGDLAWEAADGDGDREGFSASTATHKSQIVEFRDLVLHHSRAVAQLSTIILVVPGLNRHHRSILNIV